MRRLKVVSWNIWGGVNLQEIISRLRASEADIICLQEVLRSESGANNIAKDIATALGFEWVFESTRMLTPGISHLLQEHKITENKEWGNAVLSRHPIRDHMSSFLSENNKRTALRVDIEIENTVFSIFSTHLVHGVHRPETRAEQVEELLRILPDKRVILGGDFNVSAESEEVKKIEKVLTLASQNSGKEVDHIFVSKEVRVLSSGSFESNASDHPGIFVVLGV